MKIIQVSDIHLNANPATRLFGLVNSEETFLDVLNLIKAEKPDLVLATGDLAQDGSLAAYQRLNKYLSILDCPVYTIYGNHDNPLNFDKGLIGNNVKQVPLLTTKVGTFVFLSSYKNGSDSGYIDASNLQHLIASLEKYDNCILVIHHHFIPLHSIIDQYILDNHSQLCEVLRRYKTQLKFCITGHVHNFYEYYLDEIPIYSGVSSCMQFAKTKQLWFEPTPPGITIYTFLNSEYTVTTKTI